MMSRVSRAALALGAGLAFAVPARADTADDLAWPQNHGVTGPLPDGTSLSFDGDAGSRGAARR